MPTTRGHCLCKAIEYEFEGAPLWVVHCHCESCRRHTSSAVATYVGVKSDQFRYVKGEPAAYESSPKVWRYHCPRCGSPMAYIADRFPGEVHLYIGTLADPARFLPRAHIHVGEQLPWFEVADDLRRYERMGGKGVDPLRRGPRTAAPGRNG
jgi:hypothetical protein